MIETKILKVISKEIRKRLKKLPYEINSKVFIGAFQYRIEINRKKYSSLSIKLIDNVLRISYRKTRGGNHNTLQRIDIPLADPKLFDNILNLICSDVLEKQHADNKASS